MNLEGVFNQFLSVFNTHPSHDYDQFLTRSKDERLKLAKELKYWTQEQIQKLVQEKDPDVIQVILSHISNEQWRKIEWPQDDQNYVDAIELGSQIGDKEDIAFNYNETSYAFKHKSLMDKEDFLTWVKLANGHQLFMILMKTECFEHVHWILQHLDEQQKSDLKPILADFIEGYHQTDKKWRNSFGPYGYDQWMWDARLRPLLIEICKHQPLFFKELVHSNAKSIPGDIFSLSLYFCQDSLQEELMNLYFETATLKNIQQFIRECSWNAKDGTYKGTKTRCRYVMMIDQAYELLSHSRENEIQFFQDLKVEKGNNEFFALCLMEYASSNPQSFYFSKFLAQIPTNSKIFISLVEAYHIYLCPSLSSCHSQNHSVKEEIKKFILKTIRTTVSSQDALTILIPSLDKGRRTCWLIEMISKENKELVVQAFVEDIKKNYSLVLGHIDEFDEFKGFLFKYPLFHFIEYSLAEEIFKRCKN